MSSIVTDQGILHYESIGRGQPIILLHGWINSWNVWRDQMIALSNTGRYRVYALDFWGFGESAKGSRIPITSFEIGSYVEMVNEFMDSLGILAAPVFGHSMGGTVALQLSLDHADRVTKVAVVGSPVIGSSLNPFLRLAGYGLIAKLVWRYPFMLRTIMRVLLKNDSPKVRQMISSDVQQTTMESFFRSIGDLRETNLTKQLASLKIPALGIYGVNDNIVSPENARLLHEHAPEACISMMESSRHFPMADEPAKFFGAIYSFLETNGVAPNGNGLINDAAVYWNQVKRS